MATSKNKKVSIRHIDKYLSQFKDKEVQELCLLDDTEELIDIIEIKHQIDWDSTNQIIYNIVQECFGDYGDYENTYIASKKEFLFRIFILAYYTNLKIPVNDNEKYKLAFSSLYQKVVEHIDSKQLIYLHESIETQLEYEKQTRVKKYEKDFNDTINKFNTVVKNLEKFNEIDATKISSMIEKINNTDIQDLLTSLTDRKDTEK